MRRLSFIGIRGQEAAHIAVRGLHARADSMASL
jgi:hypothetical protein